MKTEIVIYTLKKSDLLVTASKVMKTAIISAVILLTSAISREGAAFAATDPDFPGIEANQPDCYHEIRSLASIHLDLKKRLEQPDVVKDGDSGPALFQTLWQASEDCRWDIIALKIRFPMLCRRAGVVGMADSGSSVPKVVFTVNNGQWFDILCDERSQDGETMAFAAHPYINYCDEWKMEDIDGRSYLICSRWIRQAAREGFQRREINQVLINGTTFVLVKTQTVKVPMK